MFGTKAVSLMMLVSFLFVASACTKKIDAKYVGRYVDVNDPRGEISIPEEGLFSVCASSGPCRQYHITMDGATATLKLVPSMRPTDESVRYPEFRGSNATFVIDRDTIVLATGTRFVKEKR